MANAGPKRTRRSRLSSTPGAGWTTISRPPPMRNSPTRGHAMLTSFGPARGPDPNSTTSELENRTLIQAFEVDELPALRDLVNLPHLGQLRLVVGLLFRPALWLTLRLFLADRLHDSPWGCSRVFAPGA